MRFYLNLITVIISIIQLIKMDSSDDEDSLSGIEDLSKMYNITEDPLSSVCLFRYTI